MRNPGDSLMCCLAVSTFALSGLACQPAEDTIGSLATAASAPAIGEVDSGDRADRACLVILGSVQRPMDEQGEYLTRCTDEGCSFAWAGSLDVDSDLAARGGVPAVLYRRASDPVWWEVPARPEQPGGPGFTRFAFQLDEHLFDAAGTPETIELIPFVHLPEGGRLFDHNLVTDDFDNYLLQSERGFSWWSDRMTCTRRPNTAALVFDGGFNEYGVGPLRAGGQVALHYDLDRLPDCRSTHNGNPAWDTTAFVRFEPGGEEFTGSLRAFLSDQGQPTTSAYPVPFEVEVPDGAEQVVIWFVNRSGAGSSCETWDSDYGLNYRFPVLPPRQADPCADVEFWQDRYGGDPGCPAYAVDAHHDATHCEFFLDGLGDGYEGHYGIPYRWLEAYLAVGPQDGQVLGAGLYVEFFDHTDATRGVRWVLGREIEPGRFWTGFNYLFSGYMGSGSHLYDVQRFAFFLDVQRPAGEVVRLWQSRQGADYEWPDAFSLPTTTSYIPYGRIEYADGAAAVFDSRQACQ